MPFLPRSFLLRTSGALGTEGELAEQNGVEDDDDGDGEPAGDACAARAGEGLHDVCAAGEQQQRDEREGQREAEHDLRENEDAQRIEAGGDDGDGRDDGDEAAQEDGELDIEEAFDDDLTGHDSYGG